MTTPDEVKACCAAAYGQDAVALLLGRSYHPGGLELSRHLGRSLDLRPGMRVADIACGPGTTARLLAREFDVEVDGVDLGEDTIDRATDTTEAEGLGDHVRFHLGDAEHLPLPDGVFDAVVCECALCTFPDKAAAAAEFARLLRPGGRVGITDVTVTDRPLPAELVSLAGWVACIADARPLADYRRILDGAGLTAILVERHDRAAAAMIDRISARLTLLRITARDRLQAAGVDVEQVVRYTKVAAAAVADGQVGYGLILAEKPGAGGAGSGLGTR